MGKTQSKEGDSQEYDDNQEPQRDRKSQTEGNNQFSTNQIISAKDNQEESKSDKKISHNSSRDELLNSDGMKETEEVLATNKIAANSIESNVNTTNDEQRSHPIFQGYGEKAYHIHSLLESIFQCTFNNESSEKNSDLRLLQKDENNTEEKILFTFENFDDLIQKILESPVYFLSDEKLIFLHNIYTRLYNTLVNELFSVNKKNEMMQIAMSYTISYLISPEVFSSDITPEDSKNLLDYSCSLYDMFFIQLKNIAHDNFIKSLINNLSEEDYDAVLGPIFKRILRDCVASNIEDTKNIMKSMELLEVILNINKKVTDFFINHDVFLPKAGNGPVNGLGIQKMTIFGACLSITAFPTESKVTSTHFTDRNSLKNPEEVVVLLRTKIHTIIDIVYKIMEQIMKFDPRYKRNILDWLYTGISVNDAKQKTYNYGSMVSSDGWFTNYLLLLVKFSQKMLEDVSKYPTWFEKIDFQFLRQKPIFNNTMMINGQTILHIPMDISNEAKGMESNTETQETKNPNSKYTFLSELVFIMNHAIMLQSSTHKMFIEFLQKLQRQQNQNSRTFLSMCIKKFAYNVQLSDPYLLSHISKLLTFDIMLMLYMLDVPLKKTDDVSQIFENIESLKNDEIGKKISLPIYWAENIQDCVLYLRQISPSTIIKNQKIFDIIMNYILKAISKETWITNPHLKAKYLQIISSLVPQKESAPNSKVEDFSALFVKNEYYKTHLIENLFNFFLEVEKTSSSSQFYEKFSYRYGCCVTINYLLNKISPNDKDSYAGKALARLSLESHDMYIQFWTMALNDMIALLDETFAKLQDIKAFQGEAVNQIHWIFSFPDRHERTVNNEQNKKLVQTFSTYLSAYYGMFMGAVKAAPDTFLDEDLKEKLIVSLNYSIQHLAGYNPMNLKMKGMRELQFDPNGILQNIAQAILQFHNNSDVIYLIANDERSFSVQLYQKLLKSLKKRQMLTEEEQARFSTMLEKLTKEAEMKSDEDKFIAEIKDIPEEFIDPIMNAIMKDPVLLPSSHTVVDRATILKHLLVDSTDPFNRSDLNKDMLVPQEELKNKIEAFFNQKRKEKSEEITE